MLPGASGAPATGFALPRVPLVKSMGALFGLTWPMISVVDEPSFECVARALTLSCAAVDFGLQVAEYRPTCGLVSFITSGGSPLVKVATIWASSTGAPQSSASRTISVSGHPTGASKLFTSPVCVNDRREGTQPTADFPLA